MPPRINFDTFSQSILAIFALLTGEDWNILWYIHFKEVGLSATLFIGFVVIIGNFILLQLFLAILINNFSQASEKNNEERLRNRTEHGFRRSIKMPISEVAQTLIISGKP